MICEVCRRNLAAEEPQFLRMFTKETAMLRAAEKLTREAAEKERREAAEKEAAV